MKLDPTRPGHYLICAGLGGAGGITIAGLLLFFTSWGGGYPLGVKVFILVVASIALAAYAITHRPGRKA